MLESRDLFVNQALMTGEPYPVEKHPGDLTGSVGMAERKVAVKRWFYRRLAARPAPRRA